MSQFVSRTIFALLVGSALIILSTFAILLGAVLLIASVI